MTNTLTEYKFAFIKPNAVEAEFDLGHSRIYKRKDGIVEIHCTDNFIYDIKHVQENHICLQKIANGGKVAVLSLTGKFTGITAELRDYLAFGYHHTFISAECFIIHSLAQRLIANFYIKVHSPKVPMRYFNLKDWALAEKWIKEFI